MNTRKRRSPSGILFLGLLLAACSDSAQTPSQSAAGSAGAPGQGAAGGASGAAGQAGAGGSSGQAGVGGASGKGAAGGSSPGGSSGQSGQSGQGGQSGAPGTGGTGASGGAGGSAQAGQSGQAGQAGQAGAGQGGALLTPYVPSSTFTALMEQIQHAVDGDGADFNGDGVPEFFITKADDGSVQITEDRGGDGTFEYSYIADASGNSTLLIDANNDGTTEREETTVAGDIYTVTLLRDTNLDGVMDQRITTTVDLAAGKVTVKTENDPDGDGTYDDAGTVEQGTSVQGKCYDQPAGQGGSGPGAGGSGTGGSGGSSGKQGCDGNDSFPTDGLIAKIPGAPISVSASGAAQDVNGACSQSHTEQIMKAVDCAVSRLDCLADTNTTESGNLKRSLGGYGSRPLVIGCGNPCGYLASTLGVPGFAIGLSSPENINPALWDAANEKDQCSLMLHELLHWAGDRGAPDHDDSAADSVYSCGRYCGKCSHAAKNGNNSTSNQDCARCADTKERKAACGVKTEIETSTCLPGLIGSFCGPSGLGCFAAAPEMCGYHTSYDCDGNPLDCGIESPCIASCPASCPEIEMNGCGSSMPDPPPKSCDSPPEYCSK